MARVFVACGGPSLEREVSLRSGRNAARALEDLGHDVVVCDLNTSFVERAMAERPDFVFIAMHGRHGEDGTIQDLLEILKIPYTGSDAMASNLCLDRTRL